MSFLIAVVKYLVGPGLTAAVVSLYVGSRAEKKKARRDYLTKEFEAARKVILEATEYAIDYFATPGVRSAKQEAYVVLYEREVRQFVLFLTDNSDKGCSSSVDEVTISLVEFLAYLTGGDFQSAAGLADTSYVRGLGFAAATLRTSLVHLRDAELSHDLHKNKLFDALASIRAGYNSSGYIDRKN